jgi:hypothetical protein
VPHAGGDDPFERPVRTRQRRNRQSHPASCDPPPSTCQRLTPAVWSSSPPP